MNDEMRKIVLEMIQDPATEIELYRSMIPVEGSTDNEFTPGDGKTVVLKIAGGANNVEINRVKIPGEE